MGVYNDYVRLLSEIDRIVLGKAIHRSQEANPPKEDVDPDHRLQIEEDVIYDLDQMTEEAWKNAGLWREVADHQDEQNE